MCRLVPIHAALQQEDFLGFLFSGRVFPQLLLQENLPPNPCLCSRLNRELLLPTEQFAGVAVLSCARAESPLWHQDPWSSSHRCPLSSQFQQSPSWLGDLPCEGFESPGSSDLHSSRRWLLTWDTLLCLPNGSLTFLVMVISVTAEMQGSWISFWMKCVWVTRIFGLLPTPCSQIHQRWKFLFAWQNLLDFLISAILQSLNVSQHTSVFWFGWTSKHKLHGWKPCHICNEF